MRILRSGAFAFLLVLTGFAALAAATCAPFLSFTIDQSLEVTQGTDAAYTVVISNTGSATQTVSIASACSPPLGCSFPDTGGSITIVPGQNAVAHLQVSTANAAPGNYTIPLQVSSGAAGVQCTDEKTTLLRVRQSSSPLPSANPSSPVKVALTPSKDIASRPGETLVFTIFAENNGAETQFVSIAHGRQDGNVFADSTLVSSDDFQLAPNEGRSVRIELTIPPSTPGGIYNVNFRATATSSSAKISSTDLPASIFVYSDTLFLRLASAPSNGDCIAAFHSNSTSRELDVINSGKIVGPYSVELQAGSAIYPYLSLSQSQFEAKQGEKTALFVTAAPTASVAPGVYPYTLLFKYSNFVALRFEDCVKVNAVIDAQSSAIPEQKLPRGGQLSLPLSLRNNGSLVTQYSLDYNPAPATGITLSITPSDFKLAPGENATATLVAQASRDAPLGRLRTPIILRSPNFSRELSLVLNVVSDNRTSPLSITPNRFVTFEDTPTQTAITVRNDGKLTLPQVQLVVQGLPNEWVRIDSSPRDLAPGQQADFLVTFLVPSGALPGTGQKTIAFGLFAASGLESIRTDAFLDVFSPVRALDVKVIASSPTTVNGESTETVVRVSVRNSGNVPASQVSAAAPYSNDYVVHNDRTLSLAPGTQDEMSISISPVGQSSRQDVVLRFASGEGATTVKSVAVPAMNATPTGGSGLFWKITAVVLLAIAILALLAHHEY